MRLGTGNQGGRAAGVGRFAVLVAAVALLGACGVPVSDTVHSVESGDVPPAFTAPTDPGATPPAAGEPAVYFSDVQGHLVASPVRVRQGDPSTSLQAVLTQLTAGPSTEQSGRGMATDLPPAIALRVVDVTDQRATLALGGDQLPATDIAQIVLSATSVAGISSVRLTLNDRPLEAPLIGGALTTRPLTAADYRSLVRAAPAT
jgi:hypothetical protein